MKCPRCGHWNQASFPRCFKCGEPLHAPQDAPEWRDQFKKPAQKKLRVVYDDLNDGPLDAAAGEDASLPARRNRAALSAEMVNLKEKRARGAQYLDAYRVNAASQGIAPSGSGVQGNRPSRFFGDVPDDPEETTYTPPEIRAQLAAEFADLPPDSNAPPIVLPRAQTRRRKRRPRGVGAVVYWLIRLLVLGTALVLIWQGVAVVRSWQAITPATTPADATLEDTEVDGQPGRRIRVAGPEGAQFYAAELNRTFVVVDGYATIDVADHTFYESIENLDVETMAASLTLTMLYEGNETRLAPITYTVNIPESFARVLSPEVDWLEVHTSSYNVQLEVTPGSRVKIGGEDISDTVDEAGKVSYNPPVRAIGENVIAITVRAPYCREKEITITLYREPTDIPLDIKTDTVTWTSSKDESLVINGTSLIGATITVESPIFNLDTTKMATTGEFSLEARLSNGYNTIRIRASYPGREDATLEHVVYYLPPANIYTAKAWALTARDYSELLANIQQRARVSQIYLCQGVITEIMSGNPQLAVMNTGTEASPQMVFLQNESSVTWEVGKVYRAYADVTGLYGEIPRLTARYTYID
ncbi:MAG: IBR domain-containing protein [Oscillospiraceae bacterium]|nr:IBR domain-containing protein [Oscillospiraceae bacterium]